MNDGILIVEDHRETCEMLKAAIEDAGFRADCVAGVGMAKEYLAARRPCLLILDLVLPDGNGLEVCRWARTNDGLADVPIIALTGSDKISDKNKGFSVGVDQYLTKPIDMGELVMWVKALLRRVYIDKCSGAGLKMLGLEMDVKSHVVTFKGKTIDNLTRREFDLLYALGKNSPKILSRKEILSHVWKTVAVENLVDTHMSNLKKKLPSQLADSIHSVPGKGFRLFFKE